MTVADIIGFIATFVMIYYLCLIAWVVLSWIQQLSYTPALRPVNEFLDSIIEPYVGIFRRFIPPVNLGGMMLDLSAIIGIIVLVIIRALLGDLQADLGG